MFEQSKNFSKLVGLSALLIAFSAAFFSVFCLSKLFSGAELSVIIMASSLEFGKLVAASFLYRYWDKINKFQKIYMTFATVVLILITSAGIFGFLSNAYQGATVEFEKQTTALLFKEEQVEQLEEDKQFLLNELDQQVQSLPDNYITAKRKLREEYNPKIQILNTEILNTKQEISDLEISLVETGVDVGPAIYLAKVFDTDIDTVVKFFIFILIFVFDPLAVILVVATNVAIVDRDKKRRDDGKVIVTGGSDNKNSKLGGIWEAVSGRVRGIFEKDGKKDLYDEKDSDIGKPREVGSNGNAPLPVEQVKEEDKAFNTVVAALRKKPGKDAVITKVSKPNPRTEPQKKKAAAERKKRQDADNKAYAARAKKAGYKSTQDYTNVVARYGSEDNYRKGKGLGT